MECPRHLFLVNGGGGFPRYTRTDAWNRRQAVEARKNLELSQHQSVGLLGISVRTRYASENRTDANRAVRRASFCT